MMLLVKWREILLISKIKLNYIIILINMTNNMTNNMAGPLNKIVLTFTEEDVEALQYKDKIKTTSGKEFITLKKFINYYTNEEKKRQ